MMRRHGKALAVLAAVLALGLTLCALVYNGTILLNNPSRRQYPVRGVDVSHWQGDIQWDVLAQQDISFAFIKATEGSSYVDDCFARNWIAAQQTGLRIGAYHFFSFDSAGETQARNFIRNVDAFPGMLPPVIDLEFYGDKAIHPPEAASVRRELDAMIALLEAHYGMEPIIYATNASYKLYLQDAYEHCGIWIRSVFAPPRMPDGRAWTFWQYTDRERLPGYSGDEPFIDMNVFCGTREELSRFGT